LQISTHQLSRGCSIHQHQVGSDTGEAEDNQMISRAIQARSRKGSSSCNASAAGH